MDAIFGFTGKDFTVLAADCSVPRSIVIMKTGEDKMLQVAQHTLFALGGEVGDRLNKIKNIILHFYKSQNISLFFKQTKT